jgi:hypothetical protein
VDPAAAPGISIEETWHLLAGIYYAVDAGVVDENGETWTFDDIAKEVGMSVDELHDFIREAKSAAHMLHAKNESQGSEGESSL